MSTMEITINKAAITNVNLNIKPSNPRLENETPPPPKALPNPEPCDWIKTTPTRIIENIICSISTIVFIFLIIHDH